MRPPGLTWPLLGLLGVALPVALIAVALLAGATLGCTVLPTVLGRARSRRAGSMVGAAQMPPPAGPQANSIFRFLVDRESPRSPWASFATGARSPGRNSWEASPMNARWEPTRVPMVSVAVLRVPARVRVSGAQA